MARVLLSLFIQRKKLRLRAWSSPKTGNENECCNIKKAQKEWERGGGVVFIKLCAIDVRRNKSVLVKVAVGLTRAD